VRFKQRRLWDRLLRGEGRDAVEAELKAGGRPPQPAWLELYLEILEPDPEQAEQLYGWFEGSTNPWTAFERPDVPWDETAQRILRKCGLRAPGPAAPGQDLATRALALLPHLYSLGVNRVRQELERKAETVAGGATNGHARWSADKIHMFPLIGFSHLPEAQDLSFDTLRTNVALFGDLMVTIRLPDLPCPDERRRPGREPGELTAEHRRTPAEVKVPDRFFPCWEAGCRDVAEEVARHQAATTRALSDRVREHLQLCADVTAYPPGCTPQSRPVPVAVRLGLRDPKPEDELPMPADELHGRPQQQVEEQRQKDFTRLAEIAEMAERQLARLLRRLGSYGDEGAPGIADLPRRYTYALDEVQTLEAEIAAARDRHAGRMSSSAEAERSQFQNTVAFAGAAILIPTLVVGVFGANVWLPGKEDTNGLIAMLFLIVACGGLGGLVVDAVQQRNPWLPGAARRIIFGLAAVFAITAFCFLFVPTKDRHADVVPDETHGLIGDLLGKDLGAG
jgi:hypothetical protein